MSELLLGYIFNDIALPAFSVLVPRLLLIGDFFDTPYALKGVEWTLRVEVMFYLFMAVLKISGLLKRSELLPTIFAITTVILYGVGPFFVGGDLFNGYFTLYCPFLFIGSLIYLVEHKMVRPKIVAIIVIGIFIYYFIFITKLWPGHKESNFALYGLLLFLCAWHFRSYFAGGAFVRFLSNLTYSAYLFHNWLWPYLVNLVIKIGLTAISYDIQVFFILLGFCYIVHITIEHYGIIAGRFILIKYRSVRLGV